MATLIRSVLWICLGGWIGALVLFAFGVAPLAFRVLPSPDLGGRVVGPLLMGLNFYGILAGVLLAGLAAFMGRGRLLIAMPLLLALLCAVSEFGITAAIAEARPRAFGPNAKAEAAASFAFLHQASRLVFGLVTSGAVAVAILHARADSLQEARKLS